MSVRVVRLVPALAGIVLLTLSALPGWAATAPAGKSQSAGNFDIRVNGSAGALSVVVAGLPTVPLKPTPSAAQIKAQIRSMQEALNQLRTTSLGATARFSPVTAAPEVVSGERALAAAAPGRPGIDIVRDYLKANSALYGLTDAEVDALHFLGESVSKRSGLRMVRVEQQLNNRPVFQSETRFILDRDGRVWRSLGLLMPGAAASSLPLPPAVSAAQALAQAMKSVGISLDASHMILQDTNANGTQTHVLANDLRISGAVASDIVYFPAAPGVLVAAWRQIVFTKGGADWYTIVDAVTGTLLWRKDIRAHASTQQARFSVYVLADGKTPADSPAPHNPTDVTPGSGTQFPGIARTIVNMSTAQDATASPNGWISDGGTTTTGNNVDAYLDTGAQDAPDTGALDNNGRPVGNPDVNSNNRDFLGSTPRDYTYSPAPLGGNPDAGDSPTGAPFQRGAVTHLFYLANWYHDQLFKLGFDEAAGNFQTTNFSGMGLGADPVLAEAQDGSGTNNANFSTPPDGNSGRMQMFIFDSPTPNRDGALDATVVLHEMTHGVSNRLIGNATGLVWSPGQGMGEGWSDFYALSLLHGSNADDPTGKYTEGAYATYKLGGLTDNYLYGIRRFPYSVDLTVNPLTWADVDDVTANYSGGIPISPLGFEFNGALEVHNVGEVWASSLWEVRSRVITDPAGANGDVPTGNTKMLQLVTDALKLTPSDPSFTDARDSLIQADCITNACANELSIWLGFSRRGLGYGAVAPLGQAGFANLGHMSVGTSFAMPHLDLSTTTVDDSLGNNNGAIDPGEPIKLSVELLNPWHNTAFGVPGATAILTSSTSGVTILTGTSTYSAIAAKNVATGTPFVFTVAPSVLCGQSIHFSLRITSTLGTTTVNFTLRTGTPSGTGAPVTYTKTLSPALAIPDGDRRGIANTQSIADDFEISSLQFRVDNIQHDATDDLTALLRAPNGYGSDLIWLRGILIGQFNGKNFINTLIDDKSKNDLNLSADSDAPYTGNWAPAFNSSIWTLFNDPSIFPDPVGQLGRMAGLSTQGDWKVLVADNFGGGIKGTLNAWSIIVTPTAFACKAFTPTVAVSGTKTVAGTFKVGGTITYTVILTNKGTGAQSDNPGDEFTDVLPPSLTLVSASATSGTALATVATNTVTWNGTILPLGGSVTITITATIKPGAGGTTISNQGTIAFDADFDGINESTAKTDDPGTSAANDPTAFAVAPAPFVTATKAVSGSLQESSKLTYTVVLTNSGGVAQTDNPGNEFTDVLPAGLTLVGATATSGTAVATIGTNTVTWNGAIPANSSVTITITATVNAGTAGQTISNQGSFSFDSKGVGTNDTSGVTDDPATPAANDPTVVVIIVPIAQVPTLDEFGLAALVLALTGAALLLLRRRRTA